MKPEEFTQAVNDILQNLNDQATVSTALAGLSDEFTKMYKDSETVTLTNAELTEKNEKLRAANMDLFSRIGTANSGKKDPADEPEETPKLKYEDLFDEKGGLK